MRVIRTKHSGGARRVVLVDDDDKPVEVVAAFIAHLGARGCSPNTQQAYTYDLLRFWRFLSSHDLTWNTVRPPDTLKLLEYLRTTPSARSAQQLGLSLVVPAAGSAGRRLSPATVNRIIAAVSSFYDYTSIAGLLDAANPIEKHPDPNSWRVSDRRRPFLDGISRQKPVRRSIRVRVAERLPRPLSEDEVDRLLASVTRWRDRAMLLLMLDGGLRAGEVLTLQLGDIEYGRRRIVIRQHDDHPHGARTKSRRERVVDLREQRTLDAVSHYVVDERSSDAQTTYVFLVDRGQRRNEPLGYAALARLFQRRCDRLGIREPWVTPHALRHTHATRMWEGGMRELTLQKRLGHTSPESTRIYTRVSDAAVVADYQRALGTKST